MGSRRLLRVEPAESERSRCVGGEWKSELRKSGNSGNSEARDSEALNNKKDKEQNATAESPHPPPGIRSSLKLRRTPRLAMSVAGRNRPSFPALPFQPINLKADRAAIFGRARCPHRAAFQPRPSSGRPSRSCAVKLSLPRLLPRQPVEVPRSSVWRNAAPKAQVRRGSQPPRFNDGRLPSPVATAAPTVRRPSIRRRRPP